MRQLNKENEDLQIKVEELSSTLQSVQAGKQAAKAAFEVDPIFCLLARARESGHCTPHIWMAVPPLTQPVLPHAESRQGEGRDD
jgi:hypothetical protein